MGTHYSGSREEVRALEAFIKLNRAQSSVAARLAAVYPAHDLTPSQFGILEALFHLGPQCQTALAKKILSSGANVTTVVDHLELDKLVRRERSTTDRRFVTVHLTKQGQALITRSFPEVVEAIVGAFSSLSTREIETLAALCRKLGLGEKARLPP